MQAQTDLKPIIQLTVLLVLLPQQPLKSCNLGKVITEASLDVFTWKCHLHLFTWKSSFALLTWKCHCDCRYLFGSIYLKLIKCHCDCREGGGKGILEGRSNRTSHLDIFPCVIWIYLPETDKLIVIERVVAKAFLRGGATGLIMRERQSTFTERTASTAIWSGGKFNIHLGVSLWLQTGWRQRRFNGESQTDFNNQSHLGGSPWLQTGRWHRRF